MRYAIPLVLLAVLAAFAAFGRIAYAPMPSEHELLNPQRYPPEGAYDVMGRTVSAAEAERLLATAEGRRVLSPANGAVRIDDALLARGREAFYRETFGNEVFLTDVLGLIDGALSPWAVSRAVIALGGRGTADLKVRLAQTVIVNGRTYPEGALISTGLDVPKGGVVPLGVKGFYDRGRIRMGLTCAACHAAYDPASGKIVEGAPNADLNVGFMLALATNSAAYFVHTTQPPGLEPYRTPASPTVTVATGATERLPEPAALERAVDDGLAAWPPGNFDSTTDLVNNPTSIPASFTRAAHPYGWSGFALVGPFRGLPALNNNVHALNSDESQQAAAAPALFGLDPEVYLGTLLQNAARERFRYRLGGPKPSTVFAAADPTPGAPGLNHMAVLPAFPRANWVTTNGLLAAAPGEPVSYANNAMSAFQNRLRPPAAAPPSADILAEGRRVFEAAGCASCHAGPAGTNNRVLPQPEVGTEPTRAVALRKPAATALPPQLFATDTPQPPPPDATLTPVPMDADAREQVGLAWGEPGTPGGYKVPPLVGLAWTAPYLHDGGVAVGLDPARDLGVPGTHGAGVTPDARNSLRALVDRDLRKTITAANAASPTAVASQARGVGHEFWADGAAGISPAQQDALIAYLLARDRVE